MRVYKPTYKGKSGENIEVKKHWLELRDHRGIVRRFAGFTDETQTKKLGEKIEKLIVHRINNEPPDRKLAEWIANISKQLRNQLVRIGILTPDRANIGKVISENIEDYRQSLIAKGRSQQHIDETITIIKRTVKGCGFNYWTDISAVKVEAYLKQLRENKKDEQGISYRRSNAFLTALKSFAYWMVQEDRASESPIRHLKCLNVKLDQRHQRRGLGPDEIRLLLETTKAQPERFGMSGYERALLYRLAAETGLRRNELRTLTIGAFDFAGHTVSVKAEHTKNHKDAVLPLRADTAADLKQFFTGKLPNANAFGGTRQILTRNTSAMIQEDLEAAGIAHKDEAGRYIDFHSLRHTTGTLLAAAGVHPRTAQNLLRHSDIRLTMGIYTHVLNGGESQAVESLPDLSQPSRQSQKARATGTDGKNLAGNLAFCPSQVNNSVQSSAEANRNGDINKPFLSISEGVKTSNRQSCYPAR